MASEKVECPNCGTSNKSTFKYCMACGSELPKPKTEQPVKSATQKQQSTISKEKIYAGVGAGLFSVLLTSFISYYFLNHTSIDKLMAKSASELNKTCPMMIDRETRFDNCLALPDKTFQYNYTLVNYEKAAVDTLQLRQYAEPLLLNLVKTSPQMKLQRDNKVIMNYCYKDKNGEYLFLISLTPDMYTEE